MKYLLLILLFTFNAYAEKQMMISVNENGNARPSDIFATEELCMNRIIEISKLNGWRKGELNLVEAGNLYSKDGLFYHATNWNYSCADVTESERTKRELKESLDTIREKLKDENLNLIELNTLLRGAGLE